MVARFTLGLALAAAPLAAEPAPVIVTKPGAYTEAVSIVVDAGASKSVLRFTLDGTDPLPRSAVYPGPFLLGATAVVKAAFFANGKIASPVASAEFSVPTPTRADLTDPKLMKSSAVVEFDKGLRPGLWLFGGRVQFTDGAPLSETRKVEVAVDYAGATGALVNANTLFAPDGWFVASWTWTRGDRGATEELSMEAKAFGYRPKTVLVPVPKSGLVLATLALDPVPEPEQTSVAGVLVDERGTPWPGVGVVLRFTHGPRAAVSGQPGEAKLETVTNAKGEFRFGGLAPDVYRLEPTPSMQWFASTSARSTRDGQPATRLVVRDLTTMVLQTAYQPDGSRSLEGSGLLGRTLSVTTAGLFTFDPQSPPRAPADLQVVTDPPRAFPFGGTGRGVFADLGEVGLEAVTAAPAEEALYVPQTDLKAGHVYVLRIERPGQAGPRFAKFRVVSITKVPRARPAAAEGTGKSTKTVTLDYVYQTSLDRNFRAGKPVTSRAKVELNGQGFDFGTGAKVARSAGRADVAIFETTWRGPTMSANYGSGIEGAVWMDLGEGPLDPLLDVDRLSPRESQVTSSVVLVVGHTYLVGFSRADGVHWMQFRVSSIDAR